MRYFGLFKTTINKFFEQNYCIKIEPSKQQKLCQRISLLSDHFRTILSKDIWQEMSSIVNYSRNSLFKTICPKLIQLSKRKKLTDIDLIDLAFIIGETKLISFVIAREKIKLDRDLLEKAILCDNENSLIYLEIEKLPVNAKTMCLAAEKGCINSLKYCVSHGFNPNKDTLDDVAVYGDMPTMQYLINELNIQPDIRTLDCIILGSGLTDHQNKEANTFIFNILNNQINKTNQNNLKYHR